MRQKLAAAIAATAIASATLPTAAADYYEMTAPGAAPVVAAPSHLPACDDPAVVAQIEDQFEYGAPRVIPANLAVVEFSNLHERAYFPRIERSNVERRYCQGQALIEGLNYKGTPYTNVYYVIEYPMGFASIGWRAEGCFLGYDDWKVYGANCESLRRF